MLQTLQTRPSASKSRQSEIGPYLDNQKPDLLKNSLIHILLRALNRLGIKIPRLTCQFCQKSYFLAVSDLLFKKNLLTLGQHNLYQSFDCVSAKVGRWSMEEILIDIREHPSGCLERVICGLEARVFGPSLMCSMA